MYGFILGLSVLFHWSICLSLSQYYTVQITVTLQQVLKSGVVSPPILVFLKTFLAILGPLQSHVNLSIGFFHF